MPLNQTIGLSNLKLLLLVWSYLLKSTVFVYLSNKIKVWICYPHSWAIMYMFIECYQDQIHIYVYHHQWKWWSYSLILWLEMCIYTKYQFSHCSLNDWSISNLSLTMGMSFYKSSFNYMMTIIWFNVPWIWNSLPASFTHDELNKYLYIILLTVGLKKFSNSHYFGINQYM